MKKCIMSMNSNVQSRKKGYTPSRFLGVKSPQGGNETEIMLRARYSGYGGMKLDPKVVEKR